MGDTLLDPEYMLVSDKTRCYFYSADGGSRSSVVESASVSLDKNVHDPDSTPYVEG